MDPEERGWIRDCQRGRRDAFEPLVKRYWVRAYTVAVGLLGHPEDAREVSQDAFLRAWRALGRFDRERPFFPWFYRILTNLCRNRLASARVRVADDAAEILERLPAGPESDPDRQAQGREMRDAIWRALAFLPTDHREILILREMQGLSYAEIAELLQIPAGTVMSRLYYARRDLRERLTRRLQGRNGFHGS